MENTNQPVEQPIIETPQAEGSQTQATENTPTETTVAETKTETAETKVDPIKPFELPTQPNPISFDKPEDILPLYKGDKKALLKHLGLDDFILQANDYYKATGNLADYAEVKSTDWTKVPMEKCLEAMLREQYSQAGLSEDKVQKLVQRELRSKYMLGDEHDSESEDVQIARIQAEMEANKYRQQRIERQNQFKAPERVQEETPTISAEQVMEQTRNSLLQDQSIQSFIQSKKVSFGDYNHVIENPQGTLQTMYDSNKWQYHLSQKNPDGSVVMKDGKPVLDNSKMLLLAAFAENPEKVIQGLIAQGKSLGQSEIIDEAENVRNRQSQGSESTDQSFWKQWKSEARIVQ